MSIQLGQGLVCLVPLLSLQTRLSVNEGEDCGDNWTALLRSSYPTAYNLLIKRENSNHISHLSYS